MYYLACPQGFFVDGWNYVRDVRFAMPFDNFHQADTMAKELKIPYYAVLKGA